MEGIYKESQGIRFLLTNSQVIHFIFHVCDPTAINSTLKVLVSLLC